MRSAGYMSIVSIFERARSEIFTVVDYSGNRKGHHWRTSNQSAVTAYREFPQMEIREVIRRWQARASPGQIASGTGLFSNTVRK